MKRWFKMYTQGESQYVGPVNCWYNLAAAVISQAVTDWQLATLKLAKPETATREMLRIKNETEHFFTSPTFEMLSGMDGKAFLRRIKAGDI